MVAARTVEALIEEIQSGLKPKWLCFWGHQPARDGSITKSCFSQWWEQNPFEVDGALYETAEHFMMAEKARLFEDHETASQILAVKHPREAKQLGRQVIGFDESVWQQARFDIVVRGSVAKFSYSAALKSFLLGTGDRVLVEASPKDAIWGIGLGARDPDAIDPTRWKGLNLLGFALMEARAQLQA